MRNHLPLSPWQYGRNCGKLSGSFEPLLTVVRRVTEAARNRNAWV